jgi:hypothetical protein
MTVVSGLAVRSTPLSRQAVGRTGRASLQASPERTGGG